MSQWGILKSRGITGSWAKKLRLLAIWSHGEEETLATRGWKREMPEAFESVLEKKYDGVEEVGPEFICHQFSQGKGGPLRV